MSLTALSLVILAALVHATWNYFLKKANANRAFWWVVYCITTVVTVPALFLLIPEAFDNITAMGWLVICISAPIHVCYGVVLQQGYKKSDYSIVYPTARGTGPLISVLAAIVFLGNTPTVWGWLGILSILVAIVFLALPSQDVDASKTLRVKKGLCWGMLTGLFIAGYTFCDAWAVQQATGLTPFTFYFPSILVRALVFAPFIVMRKGWQEEVKELFTTPRIRKSLAVVSVGSPLAFLLVLYAMTMAPLAYVAPTRELGMMVGVVVRGLFLKERLNAKRLIGVVGMTLGVIAIGLGG